MTPERLQEIRDLTRARWVPPDVVVELLAEVDRLEAVVAKVREIAAGPLYDTRPTLARLCARPLDSPPAKR